MDIDTDPYGTYFNKTGKAGKSFILLITYNRKNGKYVVNSFGKDFDSSEDAEKFAIDAMKKSSDDFYSVNESYYDNVSV